MSPSSPQTHPSTTVSTLPGLPTLNIDNDTSTQHLESRVQPWMAFANPTTEAHSLRIADAKALSVIGLNKAELVIYAAENR